MRITAAVAIVFAILLLGLGFKSFHGGGAKADAAATTISILGLHRSHPGMKTMPVDEVPAP